MTLQRIVIDTNQFVQCLHQYIDEDKPDPIQRRQLESWRMIWKNCSNDSSSSCTDSDAAATTTATGTTATAASDQDNSNINNSNDKGESEFIGSGSSSMNNNNIEFETLNFTPTHILSGTLQISNEYMTVSLDTKCIWMTSSSSSSSKLSVLPEKPSSTTPTATASNGSIRFTCHASACPCTSTTTTSTVAPVQVEQAKDVVETETTSTTTKKKKKKDRTATATSTTQMMIDRLCKDEYIQKILLDFSTAATNTEDTKDHDHQHTKQKSPTPTPLPHHTLLCSASIDSQLPNEHEERVYCDTEIIAEAIRRIIFSSSDSVLDILDIILKLPFLPCTGSTADGSHTTNTNEVTTTTTNTTTTTVLADRVRLRLLEEATYDVCNNDVEVDDLSIHENSNNNDNDNEKNNNHDDDDDNDKGTEQKVSTHKRVKRR